MVLFLIRKQDNSDEAKPTGAVWKPANKEMVVSVAWIEADRVFAFRQESNPGPRKLLSCRMTEPQLKSKVNDVIKAQLTLAEAIRQGDPTKLASVAKTLLRMDSFHVPDAVIWRLGSIGPLSLPALREILKEEAFLRYRHEAVRALVKASGPMAGQELTQILKRELSYWEKMGPHLKHGWFDSVDANEDNETNRSERDHYWLTYDILRELNEIKFAGCRETVSAVRDYWRSVPQLGGMNVDYVGRECGELLSALPK